MVAVEEGEEGRLGTGRALDSTESNVVARTLDVAEVPKEFLRSPASSAPAPSAAVKPSSPGSTAWPSFRRS